MVSGVGLGESTITVTALDGRKTAKCQVTVTDKIINVTGVSLSETEEILVAGDNLQLEAIIVPSTATDKTVTWESSDNKVASVDGKGVVTAITEGNTTITATTNDAVLKEVYKNSVDYARDRTAAMILSGNGTYFKDAIMLNGNLGEIARSYYNYTENVSGRELAALMECRNYPYAVRELQAWYDTNRPLFKANHLNALDMLFWELDWGPSTAQSKQECWIASEVCSPFNSRIMLTTLLSADAKYRVKESCRVFREVINHFAGKTIDLPVNPTGKHKIIAMMKWLGIYLPYRKFRMNVR